MTTAWNACVCSAICGNQPLRERPAMAFFMNVSGLPGSETLEMDRTRHTFCCRCLKWGTRVRTDRTTGSKEREHNEPDQWVSLPDHGPSAFGADHLSAWDAPFVRFDCTALGTDAFPSGACSLAHLPSPASSCLSFPLSLPRIPFLLIWHTEPLFFSRLTVVATIAPSLPATRKPEARLIQPPPSVGLEHVWDISRDSAHDLDL
jgi:hypothetical protein